MLIGRPTNFVDALMRHVGYAVNAPVLVTLQKRVLGGFSIHKRLSHILRIRKRQTKGQSEEQWHRGMKNIRMYERTMIQSAMSLPFHTECERST
jgi:hypothetical protein